jgi:hypothetical protein
MSQKKTGDDGLAFGQTTMDELDGDFRKILDDL